MNKFKKITMVSLAALTLLGVGAPVISSSTEQVVQAQSVDYKGDPNGIYNMGIYVNIDGQQKEVWTDDLVYAKKTGDIDTVNAPIVDGHVANPSRISFQRTATGFRLLQVPTYTKSDPSVAAKNSTTKIFYENVTVKNKNGSYCPLVAFSTKNGEIYNLTDRALSNNTKWYSDKIKTYDGAKYYRVATNEWVKDTYFAGAESGYNIGPK